MHDLERYCWWEALCNIFPGTQWPLPPLWQEKSELSYFIFILVLLTSTFWESNWTKNNCEAVLCVEGRNPRPEKQFVLVLLRCKCGGKGHIAMSQHEPTRWQLWEILPNPFKQLKRIWSLLRNQESSCLGVRCKDRVIAWERVQGSQLALERTRSKGNVRCRSSFSFSSSVVCSVLHQVESMHLEFLLNCANPEQSGRSTPKGQRFPGSWLIVKNIVSCVFWALDSANVLEWWRMYRGCSGGLLRRAFELSFLPFLVKHKCNCVHGVYEIFDREITPKVDCKSPLLDSGEIAAWFCEHSGAKVGPPRIFLLYCRLTFGRWEI